MRRKHPNKNNSWRKRRYYQHLKKYNINNRWVFTDPDSGNFMYQTKWTGIARNIMIRNEARPDDKFFKEYFIKRQAIKFTRKNFFFGDRFSRELSVSQDHICPICEQSLYNGEVIQRHHIIPVAKGGK